MQIYVHKGGKNYGPYPVEQLRDLVEQGNLSLEDLACHDGKNWVKIAEVPGFVPASEPEPVQSQPFTPVEEVENQPKHSAPKQEEKPEPPSTEDLLGILSKSNVAPDNVEVEKRPPDESLESEFVPQSISGNPPKRVSEQTNLQFDKREIRPELSTLKKSRKRTALIACTCILLIVVGTSFAIWNHLKDSPETLKNTAAKNEKANAPHRIISRSNDSEPLDSKLQIQSPSIIKSHQKVLKEPQVQKTKFITPINPNLIKPLIDPVI
jgi:hypothetical protein